MFYTTIYQRYLVELLLFGFLVFFGLAVNSQALIALGILVLSHCLPSLVLATIRPLSRTKKLSVPTFYSNGFCSFREKETVELISCALMIGVSVGLLVLSLQKITFVPLSSAYKTTILGLIYIALDLSVYIIVTITSKNSPVKKPGKSRIIRIVVALSVILIAHIEHQLLQDLADTVIGLGVLMYVTYTSITTLFNVARKHIDYTPRGIEIEDVRTFMNSLPGVVNVYKIYFRRVNEIEHELGAHVTLEHYLIENSDILKEKIKREVEREFGISGVTLEFSWEKSFSPEESDPNVIILGHGG